MCGVGFSMPGRRSGEGGGRQVWRLTLHGCLPVAIHAGRREVDAMEV